MREANAGGRAGTMDKTARGLITVEGVGGIGAMIAMLVLIVGEAGPLFASAGYGATGVVDLADEDPVLGLGVDKDLNGNNGVVWVFTRSGQFGYGQSEFAFTRLPDAPEGAKIDQITPDGPNAYSVLWDNAVLSRYVVTVGNGTAEAKLAISIELAREKPILAMLSGTREKYRSIALYADGELSIQGVKAGKGLGAKKKATPFETSVALNYAGTATTAALSSSGDSLYLGCDNGTVV